jgi:protein SCO1/2
MRLFKEWGLLLLTVAGFAFSGGLLTMFGSGPQDLVALDRQPTPPPVGSIYRLAGQWQDQHGQQLELSSLRGQPQVVAMIYGGCQQACPLIIEEMASIEREVRRSHPEGVGYLLVTMDPKVDSPERLQALALKYRLNSSWKLLRATPEQVRELASVLGVQYRKISPTDYDHSNTISVLDPAGLVVFQKLKLGSGLAESARAVSQALAAPLRPCCQH